MSRRSQDGKRRHIRPEEREQEDRLSERAIGQKVIFRRMLTDLAPEGEDADIDDDGKVGEDE